ncbi:hypothetical protein IQ06DRAFT_134061 [Phaeosphaeriaceae sp. SRC1lsM3a]|nr:hypothetical protein IQ06DRAFT_134061 [Stagonospora sp. SRC1lsM3a]
MFLDLDPTSSGYRLFPSNIDEHDATVSARKVELNSKAMITDLFRACVSWLQVGLDSYGKYVLDDFVFHLGPEGKAIKLAIGA